MSRAEQEGRAELDERAEAGGGVVVPGGARHDDARVPPHAMPETPRHDDARQVPSEPVPADGALVHSDPVVVPTEFGTFDTVGWRVPVPSGAPGAEHLSLSASPPPEEAHLPPLVRLHSECLTGDVLGSWRCDCGPQLHLAMERIARHGGTVLYLRNHEGRGIGLINKLRAYKLQDAGADTVDANTMLGLPAEARDYTAAARILTAMGLTRIRLLSNNPDKVTKLEALGITVTQMVPHEVHARDENVTYLRTKRDRMHHHLTHLTPGETS